MVHIPIVHIMHAYEPLLCDLVCNKNGTESNAPPLANPGRPSTVLNINSFDKCLVFNN